MKIIISNTLKEPIYEQIKSQLKSIIMTGKMNEGEALPSIRALAKDLQVSVITIKRAYDDLEAEGFIVTVPGKGSFVLAQNLDLIQEQKLKEIQDRLVVILDDAKNFGIEKQDIIEMIEILYQ